MKKKEKRTILYNKSFRKQCWDTGQKCDHRVSLDGITVVKALQQLMKPDSLNQIVTGNDNKNYITNKSSA